MTFATFNTHKSPMIYCVEGTAIKRADEPFIKESWAGKHAPEQGTEFTAAYILK